MHVPPWNSHTKQAAQHSTTSQRNAHPNIYGETSCQALLKNVLHLQFIHDYIAISYLLALNLFHFLGSFARFLLNVKTKHLILDIANIMSNKRSSNMKRDGGREKIVKGHRHHHHRKTQYGKIS